MHPVYGIKCFAKQTVHIWCKTAGWAENFIIYRGAISHSSMDGQQLASLFASGNQKFADR